MIQSVLAIQRLRQGFDCGSKLAAARAGRTSLPLKNALSAFNTDVEPLLVKVMT